MKNIPKFPRILAVAPITRGFGFVLIEGQGILADWGTKFIKGDKNKGAIQQIERIISHYKPNMIVLNDAMTARVPRMRMLKARISRLAKAHKCAVKFYSKEQVSRAFFPDRDATKYEIAELLVNEFPDLAVSLPPRRKLWMSEDYRMSIFDALALALMISLKKKKAHSNRSKMASTQSSI
jgi:Holliday junction resolvasome RuvABC endonuclease subunit